MKMVCSYCRNFLGEIEPMEDEAISHAVCDSCKEYYDKQWAGLNLGDYLDRFKVPVMAVDDDARLIAVNSEMADLLKCEDREVVGLLGGEAMECVYARRPEGCGNTVHCKTCTVRNTVNETMETGVSKIHVSAYVKQDDGIRTLTISTFKENNYVRVEIER